MVMADERRAPDEVAGAAGGESATVESVEAWLRSVAHGEVDLGVLDEKLSEETIARDLERRLAGYGRYVRVRKDQRAGDWYVGRPTLWANSRRLAKGAGEAERRMVVLAFARELAARSKAQRGMMLTQIRKVLRRGNKLVCWCAPLLCHAQVLAYWALNGSDPLKPPRSLGGRR
jgi:hypothetical protein